MTSSELKKEKQWNTNDISYIPQRIKTTFFLHSVDPLFGTARKKFLKMLMLALKAKIQKGGEIEKGRKKKPLKLFSVLKNVASINCIHFISDFSSLIFLGSLLLCPVHYDLRLEIHPAVQHHCILHSDRYFTSNISLYLASL